MHMLKKPGARSVSRKGAAAGSVLCGAALSNRGLRLRVLQEQPGGSGGPLRGRFVILDAGDNKHSASLARLLNRETDAAEVLDVIRVQHRACVSVANMNILDLE